MHSYSMFGTKPDGQIHGLQKNDNAVNNKTVRDNKRVLREPKLGMYFEISDEFGGDLSLP